MSSLRSGDDLFPELPREPERVLVVEDDQDLCEWLVLQLESEGFESRGTPDAGGAFELFGTFEPQVVLVDKNLPDCSGIDLIALGRSISPTTEFILITGDAALDTATRAMNAGAFGYLQKPFESPEAILRRVRAALERRRTRALNSQLAARLGSAQEELSRTRSEVTLAAGLLQKSRSLSEQTLASRLLSVRSALEVVESDLGEFKDFVRAVSESVPELSLRARLELGRLAMLEQLVRGLHLHTLEGAARGTSEPAASG